LKTETAFSEKKEKENFTNFSRIIGPSVI